MKPMNAVEERVRIIQDYHERTKHHFHRYANALDYLDWDTQPDPFRTYEGAVQIPLLKAEPTATPRYDEVFVPGKIEAAALNVESISQLFYDSMSIARWKMSRDGQDKRAVRINPSSGNLHPTEAYLLCGAVAGLTETPMVAHYSPKVHGLEKRTSVPEELWEQVSAGLPTGAVLVGLTSIFWRESWKYGERAFRYCQLDVGHAIGAIAFAAAGLGWEVRLVESPSCSQLNTLLGVADQDGPEAEHGDCLIAVFPQGSELPEPVVDITVIDRFTELVWQGERNALSQEHHPWEIIDVAAQAVEKPESHKVLKTRREHCSFHDGESEADKANVESDRSELQGELLNLEGTCEGNFPGGRTDSSEPLVLDVIREVSLRHLVRQRRSAVAMDGETSISREVFYGMMKRVALSAFEVLTWESQVSVAVFVHRVEGLTPGMYALVRNPRHHELLQNATHASFVWSKPESCPEELAFYLLAEGDFRKIARDGSCDQNIASHGSFAVAMYAEFEEPLQEHGAWFYQRLHWECGLIGQILYLESEAAGVSGTGIGCFFDNPMHRTLGLKGTRWQDLYHFTVGGAVVDERLTLLPAYEES